MPNGQEDRFSGITPRVARNGSFSAGSPVGAGLASRWAVALVGVLKAAVSARSSLWPRSIFDTVAAEWLSAAPTWVTRLYRYAAPWLWLAGVASRSRVRWCSQQRESGRPHGLYLPEQPARTFGAGGSQRRKEVKARSPPSLPQSACTVNGHAAGDVDAEIVCHRL